MSAFTAALPRVVRRSHHDGIRDLDLPPRRRRLTEADLAVWREVERLGQRAVETYRREQEWRR